MMLSSDSNVKEYKNISEKVSDYLINNGNAGSHPKEVAEKIYKISSRHKRKVQYTVGKSTGIVNIYKILPNSIYERMIKMIMMK